VESANGEQIVEVGWTVAPGLFGDSSPHLFVYHWVNGQRTCYDGCGWVQVSPTYYPGQPVAPGITVQYSTFFYQGNWWISYNGVAMGYFPGSIWGGGFTRAGLFQWFGEVDAAHTNTCTDMGSGIFGTAPSGAATMNGLTLIFNGSTRPAKIDGKFETRPKYYDAGHVTHTSFDYGGPGGC
jgi:hypothetical protein